MEEATSKFKVAIGDGATMWVSPTDEFGGGAGRVKGGAPNNGMSFEALGGLGAALFTLYGGGHNRGVAEAVGNQIPLAPLPEVS
jgi:hypothetical protein